MTALFGRIWKLLRLPKGIQLSIMRLLQDQFLVGAAGVIFNDKHEILLVKHTYRQKAWGLPGGYIKAREHPKEAIEREIEEETGLIVSADTRFKIRTDRDTARLDIVYIGSFVGGSFKPSSEVSEAKFFPFADLPQIRRSELLLIQKALEIPRQ